MPDQHLKSVCERGIQQMGLTFSPGQYTQLYAYIDELQLWNPTYRLVGATGEELITKHILDSLSAVGAITSIIDAAGWKPATICDVGSGAGLPGIPLAIALQECPVTLVERMARRVGFLHNALAITKLVDRVQVLPVDLDDVKSTFDIVTFRAFHPLEDVIKSLGKIVAPGGAICAYKARTEQVQAELDAVARLCESGVGGSPNGWNSELVPLQVPGLDAPRVLCVLTKCP